MKSFEEDTLVLIMFSSQSVVGKFGHLNEEANYFTVKHPRLISLQQNPNPKLPPTPVLKDKFFGDPSEVAFRMNDAMVIYEVKEPSIHTMYIKEVTGLTLAQKLM